MLLGKPWLRDVKVAHDWGNNMIAIQGNGTFQTIAVNRHLGINLKRLKVLLCFDYQHGITYEEDMMFVNELELFSINTINLSLETLEIVIVNTIQLERTTKITDSKTKPFCNFRGN
jgi:hypothetical protein